MDKNRYSCLEMRKLFISLFLCFVTSAVSSYELKDLVAITTDNSIFIIKNSASEQGSGKVGVWVLYHKYLGRKKNQSSTVYYEIDCQKNKFLFVQDTIYSKLFGSGDVLQSNNHPSGWRPIPPKSVMEAVAIYACTKEARSIMNEKYSAEKTMRENKTN